MAQGRVDRQRKRWEPGANVFQKPGPSPTRSQVKLEQSQGTLFVFFLWVHWLYLASWDSDLDPNGDPRLPIPIPVSVVRVSH